MKRCQYMYTEYIMPSIVINDMPGPGGSRLPYWIQVQLSWFHQQDTERHADWKHTRLRLSATLSVSSTILQEKVLLSCLFIQAWQSVCLKWRQPQGSLNCVWIASGLAVIVDQILLKSAFGIGIASSHLVATELFPLQFKCHKIYPYYKLLN